MNNTFWKSLQWVLSAGGTIGAIATYFLRKNINQQKHRLDKLKTKFDNLVIKRDKVISYINMRVSDIEVWMIRTKKLESAQDIDIHKFRDLVSKFEVTFIHGQYLLSDELSQPIDNLFDALNKCLEVYDEECEKIGHEYISCPPEETFAEKLYSREIQELFKTVKWQLKKETRDSE